MAEMSPLAKEGFEIFKKGGVEALRKWLDSLPIEKHIELIGESFDHLINELKESNNDKSVYINPPGSYWEN